MDQETKAWEWQLPQFRIDQMFGKYFKDDVHKIEYKREMLSTCSRCRWNIEQNTRKQPEVWHFSLARQ